MIGLTLPLIAPTTCILLPLRYRLRVVLRIERRFTACRLLIDGVTVYIAESACSKGTVENAY